MILAPNHQQLLSGSKLLAFALVFAISFSSCDMFKKVQKEEPVVDKPKEELEEIQGTQRYNPKTGRYETVTEVTQEMDTVNWTVTDPEEEPPITTTGGSYGSNNSQTNSTTPSGQTEFRDAYNVAFMLPFLTNRFDQITGKADPKSSLALNYYLGSKMAFDVLSKEGVQLNVSAFDTKASDAEVVNLLSNPEVSTADLIIGPVRKTALKKTAEYGLKNGVTVVSPLSPSDEITSKNPFYVQVKPSLVSHCYAITQHVLERYRPDQVVLVSRNKAAEVKRLKYFQDANYTIGGRGAISFDEFVVSATTNDFGEMDLLPHIKEGETTVFIVPSWSNESFIYSFLRQLKIAKGDNEVVVYGMPQWMKYKLIDYEYYEELNLHVSNAYFVDTNSFGAREFRRNFFNRYGTIPTEDAYAAYDLMLLVGRSLKRDGTMFQKRLDKNDTKSMVTNYRFEPVVSAAGIAAEDYSKIDRYENKYVHILKFEDYYFQLAK